MWCIIKDSVDKLIKNQVKGVWDCLNLQIECLAVREGMETSTESTRPRVSIESDSQLIIEIIQCNIDVQPIINSDLRYQVAYIKFSRSSVVHYNRLLDKGADN